LLSCLTEGPYRKAIPACVQFQAPRFLLAQPHRTPQQTLRPLSFNPERHRSNSFRFGSLTFLKNFALAAYSFISSTLDGYPQPQTPGKRNAIPAV
jgi:hypothetical protein